MSHYHSCVMLNEAIFWIRQHRKVLAEAVERPDYLKHAEKRLRWWLAEYKSQLRALHETFPQLKMEPL